MASSFGVPLFKAECLDDLSFEQFRVLIAFSERMRKEMANTVGTGMQTGLEDPTKKERTTIRITDEE